QAAWLSWDALDDSTSLIGSLFGSQDVERPKNVLRCTSMSLYLEMASTTDRISLWSELPFHIERYKGLLRKISLTEPLPDMTIGLICRDIELTTTVAATLIEMIRTACTEFAGVYRRAGATPRRRVQEPKALP
ncbi:MAG TPA: hypothetical protein VFE81_19820, partial [Paraburkholderia sp.]